MTTDLDSFPQTPGVPVRLPPTNATLPPHPLDGQWNMRVNGQDYGPFTGHQMKEFVTDGRLERSTQVRRADGLDWISASTDITLRRLFPAIEPPPMPARQMSGSLRAGDNGTIVQVNNHIPLSRPVLDPGADKSPGVALLLSVLFCGLGQLYNGEVGKGFGMLALCILLWMAFLGWIINLWSIIDAYQTAKDLRAKHRLYMASLGA